MADAESEPAGALLVFIHIPKTAGTTLRGILNMNEPGSRSKALGNVFKGGGGLSRVPSERLRAGRGPEFKPGVRLMRGHFPLGIREYLPNYLPKGKELRFFTFLREPVDRTLSHYFAIRAVGGAYRLPPLPPDASLDDALAGGYIHDNLHTRMLCGDPEPFGEVTEEMLEAAKRNLGEELVFFGLTERFDESLVLAKRRLGLHAILYRSSGRVNASRPRGNEIPAELRRAAECCNGYDIELYRHAKELFEEALASRDLEFEVELAALRAAKADGELEVSTPVPESFGGDQEAWAMLVRATAEAQRLDWERSRHRIPHLPATVQTEALEEELKAARSRASRLEGEIERLSEGTDLKELRSTTKRLEREVERLKGARSEAKRLQREVDRLQQEVEGLRTEASRATELEAEVGRLRAGAAKAEKLERQLKRVEGLRSRNKELQQDVKRLRTVASKTRELEGEVERLRGDSARSAQALEETVERLNATRSRKQKLEAKVERLRAAKAGQEAETG
jgi:hypothetical protein